MRISAPTIVDTRIDTTHVHFRIETCIAGDSEYVVASSIELQALNPVGKLVEGIADGQRRQTEVRTILQIAVRGIVRQVVSSRTVGDELLQHVLAVGKHLRAGVVGT